MGGKLQKQNFHVYYYHLQPHSGNHSMRYRSGSGGHKITKPGGRQI